MPQSNEPQSNLTAMTALVDRLETCRKEIQKRIEDAEEMTTPEVLAAGEEVNKIVQIVRSHEQERDQFIQQSFTDLLDTMEAYSAKAAQTLEEQSDSIGVATNMTKDIIAAGANIDSLAGSARLLTINAKILAASMTSQGSEVSTLAGEMKALSDEIATNNKQIRALTNTLLATLPKIEETSTSIGLAISETRDKMGEIEQQAATRYNTILEDSRKTLDDIGQCAYSAISHLQFHDPVVQRIKSIDTFLFNLVTQTNDDAGDDRPIPDPMLGHDYVGNMTAYENDGSEETIYEAGEPILF